MNIHKYSAKLCIISKTIKQNPRKFYFERIFGVDCDENL